MARMIAYFSAEKESNRHCLICLDPISPSPVSSFKQRLKSSPEYFSVTSLQHLSNYFKIDTSKLSNNGGVEQGAPTKLGNSEGPEVKVDLCVECSSLNGIFSNLCQRLEKIEMEIRSCIGHIQRKLVKGGRSSTENDLTDADADAFRSELLQKCSSKITNSAPQPKIQTLAMEQVNRKKLSVKSLESTTHCEVEDPSNDESSVPEIEGFHIRSEEESIQTSDQSDNDMASNHLHENRFHLQSDPEESSEQTPDKPKNLQKTIHKKETRSKRKQNVVTEKRNKSKSKPVAEGQQLEMAHFNPETGRYHCRFHLCDKGFTTSASCMRHYESAHLNIKHSCPECTEVFSHRTSYLRHYRDVHANLKRFRCHLCEFTATRQHNLMQHVELVHSGKKVPCKFCSKSFSPAYKTVHMRKWCKAKSRPVNG